MKNRAFLLFSILLIAPALASTQDVDATRHEKTSRSPMQLLPGYKLQLTAGFEGEFGGRIWKKEGPVLEFRTGVYNGNPLESIKASDTTWREEQTVAGHHFICVYTNSGELIISLVGEFPAEFRAKINSQQDLAEMLLVVVTFEPYKGYAADPRVIVPVERRPN